jgi:hypothetical protein
MNTTPATTSGGQEEAAHMLEDNAARVERAEP